MTDPKRLGDGEGAPRLVHLLAAVPRPRALPPEIRARSLARVHALSGTSATVAAGAGLKALLVVSVVAGAAIAASVFGGGGAPSASTPTRAITSAPVLAPWSAPAPVLPEPSTTTTASFAETRVVAAPPSAVAPTGRRPPAPSSIALDPLTDESTRLAEANAALARDPARALASVEAYDAAYPNGQLRDEAEFIAVEALLALGRTAAARARADALVVRSPKSVFARRAEEKTRDAD